MDAGPVHPNPAAVSLEGPIRCPSVVLAADIQMIIGSGMPLVLAIGFGAILMLRRRDRRRGDPGED
jgi:hypothetical protein